MWLSLVSVPRLIKEGLAPYRDLFCREAGFEHVSRYVTGLLLSSNKTLQGIYAQQVWPEAQGGSRRAMHAAVFEAGWNRDSAGLMGRHRAVVSGTHWGRGLEVMSVDWTDVHHDRGPKIYAIKRACDYVEGRMSRHRTLVTAVVANADRIRCFNGREVQFPKYQAEELGYLNMTVQEDYPDLEAACQRFIDLLHYQKNRLFYRKRTEMAVEIVRQLETESQFPQAHYAFDNGMLSLTLARLIEQRGKHWVSELERSRLTQ